MNANQDFLYRQLLGQMNTTTGTNSFGNGIFGGYQAPSTEMFQARIQGYALPALSSRVEPPKKTNAAWLDKRVDEMRVAL